MPSSARARLNFARTYGNVPAPVGGDVSTTRAWLDSAPETDCELGAIPTNDRTNSALCEILRFAQNDKADRRCGVRVSGGDLCIRKYAEAPTEPAGETFRARPRKSDKIHGTT